MPAAKIIAMSSPSTEVEPNRMAKNPQMRVNSEIRTPNM
jgi:hypothetical protein